MAKISYHYTWGSKPRKVILGVAFDRTALALISVPSSRTTPSDTPSLAMIEETGWKINKNSCDSLQPYTVKIYASKMLYTIIVKIHLFTLTLSPDNVRVFLFSSQAMPMTASTMHQEKEHTNEPPHVKTNKMPMHQAKTQISLGIRPVWSESLLSVWRKLRPLVTHWAHNKDSDQTGQLPRLIWIFTGRTCYFVMRWLINVCKTWEF